MDPKVLVEGYVRACRLSQADRDLDAAISRAVDLQVSKTQKAKKALPAAIKAQEEASLTRRTVVEECDAFKTLHGISVQDAYEKHSGKRYPYYM